jgi:Holliday junction resolvasome RuvABC endonuclease subunit
MSRSRRSSTPDISLPSVPNRDWKDLQKILCVDEALNDSGAALFIEGKYVPFMKNEIDIGLSLTLSKSASQISKIVAYDRWVRNMINTHSPHLVVLESHPFMRGNLKTSIATLEVLIGVRYVTMAICGTMGVPYAEFSTNHVKTIMCGGPSATKEMVQLVLSGLGYDLPKYQDKPELINGNVCDAIAMGEVLCRMQKQELLRREYVQDVGQGRPQTKNRSRG